MRVIVSPFVFRDLFRDSQTQGDHFPRYRNLNTTHMCGLVYGLSVQFLLTLSSYTFASHVCLVFTRAVVPSPTHAACCSFLPHMCDLTHVPFLGWKRNIPWMNQKQKILLETLGQICHNCRIFLAEISKLLEQVHSHLC
jgi:hypothetical protein